MRIRSIAAIAACMMLGNCALIIARPDTANAADACVPKSASVSHYVVDDDHLRGQTTVVEYCDRSATTLGEVTSVIADSAHMTRDMVTVFMMVAAVAKERFAVIAKNVHLINDAMHFRNDPNCPLELKPSASCSPLGHQAFERSVPDTTPAPAPAIALARQQ